MKKLILLASVVCVMSACSTTVYRTPASSTTYTTSTTHPTMVKHTTYAEPAAVTTTTSY